MAAGFKTATVTAAKVAATLTDYPAYVDLSRLGITTLAEAQSVRVYANSSKTTEWAREIVSVSEMHVKIPSLTTTTDIYVDWDGVRSDYAVTGTYGRNAVWSDYFAVYHLDEDPSGTAPQMVDSTGNGYDGTSVGSMTSGDLVAGKIGNGLDFDSNDEIALGNIAGLDNPSALSVSSWVKTTDNGSYWVKIGAEGQALAEVSFSIEGTQVGLRFNGGFAAYTGGANADDGTFHFHTATTTGTSIFNWAYYFDGVALTRTSGSDSTTNLDANDVSIGNAARVSVIVSDEVRFRLSTLSANWITTEYNNQNDEASFWGTWTDAGGGGGTPTNPLSMCNF